MTDAHGLESLGFVGGTGPQGRGLAVRLARAGHVVYLGSRSQDKAERVTAELRDKSGADTIRGTTNRTAVEQADVVVVSLPYQAQRPSLPALREAAAGKIVVNVVNPLEFDEVGPKAVAVPEGSAAEECAALWPETRVVSAFHDVPARRLLTVDEPVGCDALLCGDDPEANGVVARLAARIPGMRAVEAGPLRNSAHLENITPVLLFVNRRYDVHAAIKIEGLDGEHGR